MKLPTLEKDGLMPLSRWIGFCISQRRLTQGLSQRAFCRKCGLSRTGLGRIERCKQGLMVDTLERICVALGISPLELMAEAARRAS